MIKIRKDPLFLLLAFVLTLIIYFANLNADSFISRDALIAINGFLIPLIITVYIFFLSSKETRLYYKIKRHLKEKNRIFYAFLEPVVYSFIAIFSALLSNGLFMLSASTTYYLAIFFSLFSLLQIMLIMSYVTKITDLMSDEIEKLQKEDTETGD